MFFIFRESVFELLVFCCVWGFVLCFVFGMFSSGGHLLSSFSSFFSSRSFFETGEQSS